MYKKPIYYINKQLLNVMAGAKTCKLPTNPQKIFINLKLITMWSFKLYILDFNGK